jgi:hypothetical protein
MIPLKPSANDEAAPLSLETSIAFDVPIACDVAPNEIPFAKLLFTLNTFITRSNINVPPIPVTTTAKTVIEGIPPKIEDASIANGVVIDFGINV